MNKQSNLLSFAENVAYEAGKIILEYFYIAEKGVQIKIDKTQVTEADKKINQLVIDKVATSYSNHGVLAEEGSSHEDRSQLWVCDPIDGTRSFIQRIPTSVFSLAYVVDGEPQVAVIYDPFQDALYSAERGEGARMNGTPISVSSCNTLEVASIAISTGYNELKDRRLFFDGLLNRGVNQVIVPGNVFKSTLVATGNIDGYIFPGKSAHDVAAAKLIIEEAGGKVTNLHGKEQRYDHKIYGAIITNGHLHNQIVSLLQDFNADNYIGY